MTTTTYAALAAGLLTACLAAPAAAGTISSYGTYRVHNHPDGGARSPLYGLRLDGLLDNNQNTEYTFDFDDTANGAAMFMTYFDDGGVDKLRIYGKAWGGKDVGSAYATSGAGAARLWAIDFTYTHVTSVPGDDDLWIDKNQPAGTGTIRPDVAGSTVTQLQATAGSHDYYFRLGDENDDSGHRMSGGVSGWGWMNHQTPGVGTSLGTHLYASDWLFTVDPVAVPLPPSAWMGIGLLGALGLGRLARRRKTARAI